MTVAKYLIGPAVVASSAVLIAGCGGSGSKPGEAAAKYDITRVGAVKSSLPAGFDQFDIPKGTVTQDKLDAPGVGGLTTTPPAAVNPPECASMIKPLAPAGVGAETEGFVGSQDAHTIVVMAAKAAKTVGELGHSGCDHITVDSPDGISATVDRIPGPDIPGAQTMGVQAHITANAKNTQETTYTAVMGDRTVAVVQADIDPQVAKDLLGKVVAALKG
ncbi:MAG: DUF5642 family protein [Mycobacterium sp.]|nr:DUF5642 family protein [Mycobacterium sp.]